MTAQDNNVIWELIRGPAEDFTHHLELENNNRILFSAPYGFGKTTFLKEYFSVEGQHKILTNNKYEVIHLFPVNYSVATNEDIFKYLKYDIIYELLGKDIELESHDFSYLETLPFFVKQNIAAIVTSLLFLVPKVGKIAADGADKVESLRQKFLQFHKKLNVGDTHKLTEFDKQIIEKEGSLYEENIYTQFIENALEQLKGESEKETVLILDDLDRIDPHHIFRLFNVFAAHFDRSGDKLNKFGFDKVIFVCDIKNIRNIFKSNFGDNVDFSGYIDKFYSQTIFYFNNRQALREIVKSFIEGIKYKTKNESFEKWINQSHPSLEGIVHILEELINARAINLRSLFKIKNQAVAFKQRTIYLQEGIQIANWQSKTLLLIDFLLTIIGDLEALEEGLTRIENWHKETNEFNYYYSSWLADALAILTSEQHKFRGMDKEFKYFTDYRGKTYHLTSKIYRSISSNDLFSAELIEIKDQNNTLLKIGPSYIFILSKVINLLKITHQF